MKKYYSEKSNSKMFNEIGYDMLHNDLNKDYQEQKIVTSKEGCVNIENLLKKR